MTSTPSSRRLRVPLVFVNDQWEFKLGGQVPVKDGAVAELSLERSHIKERKFLEIMERRDRHLVLTQGKALRVALNIKPDHHPIPELMRYVLPFETAKHEIGGAYADNWNSVPPSFIEISISAPNAKQSRILETHSGGLWLLTKGIEAVGLVSTTIELPKLVSEQPVQSLNHAYTRLSEIYEVWRISHTGNIYSKIFYQENNKKWYPLDLLRDEKLIAAETEIASMLWKSFLRKMAPPPAHDLFE